MNSKIAINGFGRIGRTFFRAANKEGLNIVAINDLVEINTLAHLLKYDSTYGEFPGIIKIKENNLIIDGQEVKCFSQKDPEKLPWKELDIDIVVESTGFFTEYDLAAQHLKSGAKRVIISAPTKSEKQIKTFVLGVNEDQFNPQNDKVISMASCTTNCLVPVADVLEKKYGIEKALMTTVHSVTMDQRLQDAPHKDLRRARSTLQSIIPTTTGATVAASKVIPSLEGKMDGLSLRVPTPTVSVVDFVALLKKNATKEELNNTFIQASEDPKYQNAIEVTFEPKVSIDFKASPAAAIIDLDLTQVVDGNLVKVIAWYDNEMGYSIRLAEFIKFIGKTT